MARSSSIYDVTLTSDGFTLRSTDLPDRAEDRRVLPLAAVPNDVTVGHTAPWRRRRRSTAGRSSASAASSVRVSDATGPAEKALFKSRLSTVEQHFYKRLLEDGPN